MPWKDQENNSYKFFYKMIMTTQELFQCFLREIVKTTVRNPFELPGSQQSSFHIDFENFSSINREDKSHKPLEESQK